MEADIRTAFDAGRLNEQKFSVQDDEEMTKAIPVITDGAKAASQAETPGRRMIRNSSQPKRKTEMAVGFAGRLFHFHYGGCSCGHRVPVFIYA